MDLNLHVYHCQSYIIYDKIYKIPLPLITDQVAPCKDWTNPESEVFANDALLDNASTRMKTNANK